MHIHHKQLPRNFFLTSPLAFCFVSLRPSVGGSSRDDTATNATRRTQWTRTILTCRCAARPLKRASARIYSATTHSNRPRGSVPRRARRARERAAAAPPRTCASISVTRTTTRMTALCPHVMRPRVASVWPIGWIKRRSPCSAASARVRAEKNKTIAGGLKRSAMPASGLSRAATATVASLIVATIPWRRKRTRTPSKMMLVRSRCLWKRGRA